MNKLSLISLLCLILASCSTIDTPVNTDIATSKNSAYIILKRMKMMSSTPSFFVIEVNGVNVVKSSTLFKDTVSKITAGKNHLKVSATRGPGRVAKGEINFSAKAGNTYKLECKAEPYNRGYTFSVIDISDKKTVASKFIAYDKAQQRTKLYTPQGVLYY